MWNPGGWSGIPVHQDMSGSRILPRRSSSTFGVWKGAVYNMPQSNVRKEPPPACHRQGEVVPYVCIRPPHPITRVWFSLTLSADDMGHRRSVSTSFKALGIQRVFVWYSEVFGTVFRVFGFSAQQQVLHIPHLALLQIPTNYPFYNINKGESGNQGGHKGGRASPRTRPYHFLEFYHAAFVPAVVAALGVAHTMPTSIIRK